MLAPNGIEHDPGELRVQRVDDAIVKAFARAFRWREMLESGQFATIKEMAAAERINHSYVARVKRLTLVAPDIVEAIMSGKQPHSLTLPILMNRLAPIWADQRSAVRLIS